ncbi:hypothetical protein [Leucobacter chromiireducens]|uniref:hypothetical protein n=1 Tax=Leucobacter chromiireducens TaxID=283877 RepID=UPI001928AC37|nr:hypothetical protein [Leucobacter chromiireducens]
MSRSSRHLPTAAALAAGVALLIAGCSSGDTETSGTPDKPTAEPSTPPAHPQGNSGRTLHTLTADDIAAFDAAVSAKLEECGGAFDFAGPGEFDIGCATDPSAADFAGSLTDAPVVTDAGDGSDEYFSVAPTRETGTELYLPEPDVVGWKGGIFLLGAGQSGEAAGLVDLKSGELINIALNY